MWVSLLEILDDPWTILDKHGHGQTQVSKLQAKSWITVLDTNQSAAKVITQVKDSQEVEEVKGSIDFGLRISTSLTFLQALDTKTT